MFVDNMLGLLERILAALRGPYETGFLPITGIGTGAAYASGDAFGGKGWFPCPKHGTIHSLIFLDRDNEKLEKDLVLSISDFAATADNAAFAPASNDLHVGNARTLTITAADFKGFNANALATLTNVGLSYHAPAGRLHYQWVTRGADNIAAGAEPLFGLVIL